MPIQLAIALLVFAQLIMPIHFVVQQLSNSYQSQLEWILNSLFTVFYFLFVSVIGRWDFVGYFFRYVLLTICFVSIGISFLSVKEEPFLPPGADLDWVEFVTKAAMASVFGFLFSKAIIGWVKPKDALDTKFPFRNGNYYVAHGGSAGSINYHFHHRAQKYALDIVQLYPIGFRAKGLYPTDLSRYKIFDQEVCSPADGKVLFVADHFEDLIPPNRDTENKAGNHVVIQPTGQNCYVLLAHLKKDSVCVQLGDEVKAGTLIGRIGNSGNTTEPHLHIHCATLEGNDYLSGGNGIPISFNRRFLVRNSVVRSKD